MLQQKDLAGLVGATPQQLNNILHGRAGTHNQQTIELLARMLGTDPLVWIGKGEQKKNLRMTAFRAWVKKGALR